MSSVRLAFLAAASLLALTCSSMADGRLLVPPRLHPNEVTGRRDDPGPGIEVNEASRRIVRKDATGKVLWSAHIAGDFRGSRSPHILHDRARLYIGHSSGLTALDRETGNVAWALPRRSCNYLHLSGGLLLAVEIDLGQGERDERWFVGFDAATGKQAFETALPGNRFEPQGIQDLGGLLLVQATGGSNSRTEAFLFTHAGKLHSRFDRLVLDGARWGEHRIILTEVDARCFDIAGKQLWVVALGRDDWLHRGSLIPMPEGDFLSARHCPISDSGVMLSRIDPKPGKEVWRVECEPFGTDHSKYLHVAKVDLEAGRINVTSRGSHGSFVELRHLGTGELIERATSKEDEAILWGCGAVNRFTWGHAAVMGLGLLTLCSLVLLVRRGRVAR